MRDGWIRSNARLLLFALLATLVVACGSVTADEPEATATVVPEVNLTAHAELALERDPDVPSLPFPDNPDPNACGIPTKWGLEDPAWVSGEYEGEMVQQQVLFYDSHQRIQITGSAPSGSRVQIILYQSNPVLDYYLVRTMDLEPNQEGWIPEHFLRFDPPGAG